MEHSRHGGGAGHAHRLAGQASLAEEVAGAQKGDHCFLALFGDYRELDLAFLDIEEGIGWIALQEDLVILRVVRPASCLCRLWLERLSGSNSLVVFSCFICGELAKSD